MAAMTDAEKIAMVKIMTDETVDDTISAYLKLAGEKILRHAFPYDDSVDEVPAKYDMLHVDATVYLLNKRGGEGETAHNENGISRTYEDADLPRTMLNAITPVMGVPG